MPDFLLFNAIPGIQILAPVPLALVPGTSVPSIKVRFTDRLLWMPEGQDVTVTGAYDALNERLTLSGDFAGATIPAFLNNQLQLTTLSLTIAVTGAPDGSGDRVLDTSRAAPVTASGHMRWTSETVARLQNDAQGVIDLAVSYQYLADGQSGFHLALAQAVALDRVFVKLLSASLHGGILPEEPALILTLSGAAEFVAGGTFIDRIQQLLSQIFGAANLPALDPPAFIVQHRFSLNGALPDRALEPPTLSLLPAWSSGPIPAVNTIAGVDVTLGHPCFTLDLPAVTNPLPDLACILQNSSIRLPDLPGWGSFDLIGNLEFVTNAGGWHLRFTPTRAGMVDLPDVVRWLLAQLSWPALALPFLEDLPGALRSLAEQAWYELFRDLLGSADPAAFATAFDEVIDGALATNAPFTPADLYALAFRALHPQAGTLYPLVWRNWLQRFPMAFDYLLALLRAAVDTIQIDDLATLLNTLFDALDPAQVGGILTAVLEWGAGSIDTTFETFLKLWLPLLAAANRTLDPHLLATVLWDILRNAAGVLAEYRQYTELPMVRLPSIVDPDFLRLRTDILLIGSGLQGLALYADWLPTALAFTDTNRFFTYLTQPFRASIGAIFPRVPQAPAAQFLSLLLAFFANAEGDEASETIILQFGRFGFLGVLLAAAGAVWNGVRPGHLVPWARLLYKSIEEEDGLNIKRLDPPGKLGRKYLIVSDIHRDQTADNHGAMAFGSIDHFSVHQQLYKDLIDYADNAGYTMIEAGDGEELWFVRDFEQYPPGQRSEQLLRDIISTHQAIYDKQASMHSRDRFFRIIGNHDSQLRDPSVRRHLVNAIERPGMPFTLYDYLIIPQVKTMDDGLLTIVSALWKAGSTADRVDILRDELIFNRIGLDSHPYTSRKPLVVTHGHQWDFWNCDANNLVGKLLANTVGVPFDMLNDPFTDMGGITYNGTALVNFQDLFAELFVFNNFPTHLPARKFAHTIQHMPEEERFLVDDIMFIETIAALASYLAMPLTYVAYDDATGVETARRTWSSYLADLGALSPDDALVQLFDHLFNQLCIGHTHYPQAAPYFDIEAMLANTALADSVDSIRERIAEHLFGIEPTLNVVKSRYYNSGTAGWQEGLIWAIEINEYGEARLVYWTADTRIDRPQEMDWQLPRMDDTMRATLDARKDEVEAYLTELAKTMGDSLVESARTLGSTASLPLAFLAGFAGELAANVNLEVRDSGRPATGDLKAQLNQMTGWLTTLFLRLMQRQLPGGMGGQSFTLAVPLPGVLADALLQVERFLSGLVFPDRSTAGDRLTELACVWLLATHGLGIVNRANRAKALLRTGYPIAWLVIALAAMLPAAGDTALPLSASVVTEQANGVVLLKLTVTIT